MNRFTTAWLRIENGHAVICSWCEDAVLAERRATASGLKVTHSVCPECAQRNLDVSNGHGAPAQAAVASTPSAGAPRVGYILLHDLADICGCDGFALISNHRPAHWIHGRDFHALPGAGGFEIRTASVPDLVGELSVTGGLEAAKRLWRWLVQRVEVPAVDAAEEDHSRRHREPWMATWEREHQ